MLRQTVLALSFVSTLIAQVVITQRPSSGSGSGNAPVDAQYVVGAANATLTNELVLAAGCANFLTIATSFDFFSCITNESGTGGAVMRATGASATTMTLNGTTTFDGGAVLLINSLNTITTADRIFATVQAGAAQTGLFRALTINTQVTNANIDTASAGNFDLTVTGDTLNIAASVVNSSVIASGTTVIPVTHGYYTNLVLTGADVDITGHAKGFYQATNTIGAGSIVVTYSAFYSQDLQVTGITNPYFLWYDGLGSNCDGSGVYRVNGLGIMAYYNPCFAQYVPAAVDFERIIARWGDTGVFGTDNRAYIGVEEGGTGTDRAVHIIGANVSITSTLTPAVSDTSANSCGTGTETIAGNDNAGKVTVIGSAGTSCTVTFATPFLNAPSCTVNNETTANLARATSTTTTVILAGTFLQNDVVSYICLGR